MTISKELKDILACPKCKGSLHYPENLEEVRCLVCNLAYRIDEGIPIMLVEEAKPINKG